MISDATIANAVKTALVTDPRVGAMDITVHSHRGRVQLLGEVTSPDQAVAAEELARAVPGVVAVLNNLRVAQLASAREETQS
ncbi:MAG: BON domain-containing protein [Armatimonadetes bacterium]|jgi:osmotically-inducible protein OsmY|nr:BON domain-containing protein [Armatimonadota bacterium]